MPAPSHESLACVLMSMGRIGTAGVVKGSLSRQAAARGYSIGPLVNLVIPETLLPSRAALVAGWQRAVAPEPTPAAIVTALGSHGPEPGLSGD